MAFLLQERVSHCGCPVKGPGVFYRAEIFWRVRRNRAWHLRWDLAQAVSLAQGLWGSPGALPPRLVARIWVARQPRQFPLVLPGCSLPSLRTPPCPSWSSPSLLAVTCPGTCVPRDAYGGGTLGDGGYSLRERGFTQGSQSTVETLPKEIWG